MRTIFPALVVYAIDPAPVVYAIDAGGQTALVQAWIPADRLRPTDH